MMDESFYYIVTLELGTVVLDINKNIVYFNKFKDPIKSHSNFVNRNYNEIIEIIENNNIFKNLNNIKILANLNELINLLKKKDIKTEKLPPSMEIYTQINKLNIYLETNQFSNEKDIINQLREFSLKWSSIKIQEASEQIDLHISQSINALDEIDKISNTLGTRMREWYGLHFPELDNLLQNATTFANIVTGCGQRENITSEFLNTIDMPENKIEIIIGVTKRSRGGKITEQNLSILQDIAQQVIGLSNIRKNLEEHIEKSMDDIAPNVKGLLTANVGARLISKAGSLKKLSSMSASTIQILGAEKALFRTLKTGSNPPKHGILFQHPLIHSAPKWQRGKMARAIAAKAAIAARLDVYGQDPAVNQNLSNKMNERIAEIQEKYKEPPVIDHRKSILKNNKRFGFDRNSRKKDDNTNWKGKSKKNDRFKNNKFKKRYHKSNKK
jgi:nucleolar protein 56